ncbi:MAG TPA: MarR family transcriptional regulator [Propionicimonas sp.]|nr:MarR family transcriptional regulator [Propionicimonas sp.]
MGNHLTATLHELVYAMDGYADRILTTRFGVGHNHFVFLSPLSHTTLDVTRLAAQLNLTKAAVSKRVPQLSRAGWLAVAADPDHGRRVLLTLTDAGQALVDEAGTLLNDRFSSLLAATAVDQAALTASLTTLVTAVRGLSGEGSAR